MGRAVGAWLIQCFINSHARLLQFDNPAGCPAGALGFDFDGATFTHVGERISFEVLIASFGFDGSLGLVRLGTMAHALDVSDAAMPEAGGFEAILADARKRLADSNALFTEVGTMLDSLYVHFSGNRRI